MRCFISLCLLFCLFVGCKKDDNQGRRSGEKVEIYLLQSFSTRMSQSTNPASLIITNAKRESSPLIADNEIEYYTASTHTFKLKKDINALTKNFGPDKAFVVTVDNEPVYYGKFHPLYLSSMIFGLATIAPGFVPNNELMIFFVRIEGNPAIDQLDKRNDPTLLNALNATGRLR